MGGAKKHDKKESQSKILLNDNNGKKRERMEMGKPFSSSLT
jgi:hypothetical protein